MRKPFIAGNWKMNTTLSEGEQLAVKIRDGLPTGTAMDIAVIPPFTALERIASALDGSPISVGAQDVYFEKNGAFTGEISCAMLKDVGCSFALVGHSERRHVLGETDELIRRKLDALIQADLEVILCVGEQLDERQAGTTEQRLEKQIRAGLEGLNKREMQRITIAYEPVWAIGTGHTATASQAAEAHLFIRNLVAKLFDRSTADAIRIQYGGSVKPENAGELMSEPDVDGALIGGASLKADSFLGIVEALLPKSR